MALNNPLNYRMPAEWEPHDRCWLAWPCRPQTWDDGLIAAREATAQIARTILRFEPVTMVVRPEDAAGARAACGPNIDILAYEPLVDSWMRDTGPTFVVGDEGELAGVDWRFNAWGGLYLDTGDEGLAGHIMTHLIEHCFRSPLVLEGGSIHVDGEGTLMTTEQCLLNPNRNPHLTQTDIEGYLSEYLRIRKFIWLEQGLHDDHTDGHVDNIACFVAPGVVMTLVNADREDPDHEILDDNLQRLKRTKDARGRRLEVIEVQQPLVAIRDELRLPRSYINFYIANNGVVMPSFDDPKRDEAALGAVQKAFPNRAVVQLPADAIIWGGGGIHCITQQQPRPNRD